MPTDWALVCFAHEGLPEDAHRARCALLEEYRPAALAYLRRVARDPDLAEDLHQEFCVRFLRGDFRNADPSKGELGVLIKTSLRHMVIAHHKRETRHQEIEASTVFSDPRLPPHQQPGLEPYRRHILGSFLDAAWDELRRYEDEHPDSFRYTALKLRSLYPDESLRHLADVISALVEHPVTENAVRILLHDARVCFARAVWRAARESSPTRSLSDTQGLLQDLGLWNSCKRFLVKNSTSI